MKIAFLFLCKNEINKLGIWEKFFKNNEDKSNVYIHCYDRDNITQLFVKKHLCDKLIPSSWGDVYKIIKYLMKTAIENDADNYKFVLVTESCIPIKSFEYTYKYLTQNDKTYLKYTEHIVKDNGELDTNIMQLARFINNSKNVANFMYNIDISHWHFNESWFICNLKHALIISNDQEYINYFNGCFATDENYPSYILSINNLLGEVENEKTTYVNWIEAYNSGNGKIHPKMHVNITQGDLINLKEKQYLFGRKFSKDSNIDKYIDILWNNQ